MIPIRDRVYYCLLATSGVLFLILFFELSYYNRLAADDLYYLGDCYEIGMWGCMSDLYSSYSGRWSAYSLTGWVVRMNGFRWYHLLFNCFTLMSLNAVLFYLSRKIISAKYKVRLSNKVFFLFSILLTCNLFFTSYGIGETWFWLVQVCTYLWSIIMSLVLLYVLLVNRLTAFQIILIIMSASFIGGASESYALVNIFLLSVYLMLTNLGSDKWSSIVLPKNRILSIKIIVALVFLILSFAVTMSAPGNEVRYGALPKGSFDHLIWVQIKAFVKIIFIKTPRNIPYLVVFSFPWFVLGRHLSMKREKEKTTSFLNSIKANGVLAFILVFIFLIPTSMIMVELGPDRSLSFISFFIVLCFVTLFFVAGSRIMINDKLVHWLKYLFMACTIGILSWHLLDQYFVTKEYAESYDRRIKILSALNENGQKGIVVLDPLPRSGMLFSAEISADSSHFTNQFIKNSLHLQYDIRTID